MFGRRNWKTTTFAGGAGIVQLAALFGVVIEPELANMISMFLLALAGVNARDGRVIGREEGD